MKIERVKETKDPKKEKKYRNFRCIFFLFFDSSPNGLTDKNDCREKERERKTAKEGNAAKKVFSMDFYIENSQKRRAET